ncbi:acyl-coenzyme A thioesterase 1-like [Styela clava]
MAQFKVPINSLADEAISIIVTGLEKEQKVTIQSVQTSDKGQMFHAFACYVADKNGIVNVETTSSVRGSYVGIEDMGLFWAMRRPQCVGKSFGTLIKTDITSPDVVRLEVFGGHLKESDIWTSIPLASTSIYRWYNPCNVKRIQVDDGIICGTLFVPGGQDELPGVLDLAGIVAGVFEQRGALLANHGFVVLSLGLIKCGNRPDEFQTGDMNYIVKAIDFLSSHKNVKKGGICVMGSSYGGVLALASSTCSENVKCVVNTNGPIFACLGLDIKYRNECWKSVKFDEAKISVNEGVQNHLKCYKLPSIKIVKRHIPEFYKTTAAFLFCISKDDQLFACDECSVLAEKMFQLSNNINYKITRYRGAGHIILPPYTPLIKISYHPIRKGLRIDYGGNYKDHSVAQVKIWNDIIEFLNRNFA